MVCARGFVPLLSEPALPGSVLAEGDYPVPAEYVVQLAVCLLC
jgi:hypothetical protein